MISQLKKQAGDTLVEVMISIAVIALAIAISYAISGKNLNVGITARERTSAVGLVQGQIERMKEAQQINAATLSGLKSAGQHFCFNTSSAVQNNSAVTPNNNNLAADTGRYNASCISGGKFYLDINYVPVNTNADPTKSSGNSFMFTARWFRLGGGTDQVVTIYYRPW
jgi:prepilin-type N-terminal cleavage/methylation domain-containing protein